MSKKAFTLIEIMVVLAVAAVIFGVSIPHFARFISGRRLEAGASEISSTLRAARSYASSKRRSHYVNFDLEKEEFWISYKDPAQEEKVLEKVFRVPQGIKITQTTFFEDKVRFRTRGRPSKGGSIWIADKEGNIRRITVSGLTGVVKIDQIPPE